MTKAEIVRSYREAKYKREQINILADLSGKTVSEIEKILVEAGETLPPKRTVKAKKPVAKTPEIKIERVENGIITVKEEDSETKEGNKFFDALEKDIESSIVDRKPKKLKELPEHVRFALTNELRRLDAQIEDIQKKKAQIIDYMIDTGDVNG